MSFSTILVRGECKGQQPGEELLEGYRFFRTERIRIVRKNADTTQPLYGFVPPMACIWLHIYKR
ncbi:MAG: hypothetical protein AUK47_02585 [Deltaproteobacteria bacterium CG2_30_63_29]|nr:MAG: hypothetical protein AUK47_02585 [Deltaproteobacteria bacterium CG2_30_63_29]